MRFALVDDMAGARERVLRLLSDFCKQRGLTYTVDSFSSGEEFLDAFVPLSYDIVFMDIYMDGMTGIEVAEKLRETDSRCLLIFLTASQEHMSDAFSTHAFDYVTKPVEQASLFKCLTDALRILPEQEPLFSFSSNGTTLQLPYNAICSVRSSAHSSVLTDIKCREYTISAPFTSFVKPLEAKDNFLLVSRGILVNLDYVTDVTEKECLLQNGASVPITLRRQKQLAQIWRNYDFAKLHRNSVSSINS